MGRGYQGDEYIERSLPLGPVARHTPSPLVITNEWNSWGPASGRSRKPVGKQNCSTRFHRRWPKQQAKVKYKRKQTMRQMAASVPGARFARRAGSCARRSRGTATEWQVPRSLHMVAAPLFQGNDAMRHARRCEHGRRFICALGTLAYRRRADAPAAPRRRRPQCRPRQSSRRGPWRVPPRQRQWPPWGPAVVLHVVGPVPLSVLRRLRPPASSASSLASSFCPPA